MIIYLLQYAIAWMDWPEAMAAIAITANFAHFWLVEKREARSEARRDALSHTTKQMVKTLDRTTRELADILKGVDARVQDLEEK